MIFCRRSWGKIKDLAVADRPTVMAGVKGRPFITYLMDQLEEAGLRKDVLCTGYMAEYVEDTLETKTFHDK